MSDWLNTPIEQMTPEQLKALDDMVLSEGEPEPTDPTGTFSADKAKSAAGQDRPSIRDQGPEGSFAFHTPTSADTMSLPMPETHVQTSTRDVHTPDAPASSHENRTGNTAGPARSVIPPSPATQAGRPSNQTRGTHVPQMAAVYTPSVAGSENMSARTPIIVTPEVPHSDAAHTTSARQAASFRAREMAPLSLTPEQIQDAKNLRNVVMEFAVLSNNKYIPQGLQLILNDIMRLFIARGSHELESTDMIHRLVAAEILELKKIHNAETKQQNAEMDSLKHKVHAMQTQMDAYNAEHQSEGGNPDGGHPPSQHQAHTTEPVSRSAPEVQKLTYMSKMGMFEGHLASPFRSWQEWSEEFLQRAVLVHLSQDHFYAAASVQLAQYVRDAWIAHTKTNPGKDNWASLQEYIKIQYAPLDKSADAEKRFMDQRMTHETEQALQTFSNIQIRNITEMGADSSLSSKGLWDHYMAGLYGPLSRSATTIYANEKAPFDTLSPIGRITKMQERLMPQLMAHRSTHQIAEASGPHLASHSKRMPEADISRQQISAQPKQKIQRLDMSSTGRQPRSDTHYWATPNRHDPRDMSRCWISK